MKKDEPNHFDFDLRLQPTILIFIFIWFRDIIIYDDVFPKTYPPYFHHMLNILQPYFDTYCTYEIVNNLQSDFSS